MAKARVLNDNYIESDEVVSFTYSSQKTAAPASNVYANKRRSQVWRSNGYWDITSSNNVIKFKETAGGSTLTATIAVAEYTQDSDFLTAIKTALEATGDSTYTVTRDTTTNKIKITSNGSGGGGAFQLLWTNVLSTAASILGFATDADDTGALTYTADTLKIHTAEWLKWDLGISSNPKAFVLVGLRNTAIKLSGSATIKIQGNSTDVWTSPEYSATLTYNENAVTKFGSTGLHTSALRYWRVLIVDASNSYGYLEISNIYLGDMIETTQGAIQFPLAIDYLDLGVNQESEMGVIYSTVRQPTRFLQLDWYGLTTSEIEDFNDFIHNFGTSYPFFVCLDPDEVFSTDNQDWVLYVRFSEQPSVKLTSPNFWESSWKIREEL